MNIRRDNVGDHLIDYNELSRVHWFSLMKFVKAPGRY